MYYSLGSLLEQPKHAAAARLEMKGNSTGREEWREPKDSCLRSWISMVKSVARSEAYDSKDDERKPEKKSEERGQWTQGSERREQLSGADIFIAEGVFLQ